MTKKLLVVIMVLLLVVVITSGLIVYFESRCEKRNQSRTAIFRIWFLDKDNLIASKFITPKEGGYSDYVMCSYSIEDNGSLSQHDEYPIDFRKYGSFIYTLVKPELRTGVAVSNKSYICRFSNSGILNEPIFIKGGQVPPTLISISDNCLSADISICTDSAKETEVFKTVNFTTGIITNAWYGKYLNKKKVLTLKPVDDNRIVAVYKNRKRPVVELFENGVGSVWKVTLNKIQLGGLPSRILRVLRGSGQAVILFERYLIAMDLKNGNVLFSKKYKEERAIDFVTVTTNGEFAFYYRNTSRLSIYNPLKRTITVKDIGIDKKSRPHVMTISPDLKRMILVKDSYSDDVTGYYETGEMELIQLLE